LNRRWRKIPLDTEAAELMQFVLEGVQRMSALIKDVLAFANITQPDSRAPRPVSVQAALRESLGNLQAAIAESGALITHDNLPTMVYDLRQLSQLFQNLIGNAIKYRRPEEPPQIYIAVERQGREWIFSIRDNGIGFESAESERIFGVFKRLHGREVAGTGIGLAICRRIVEHHGGCIWAESAPGVGSTFSFTVPV
jgi:light-regulated signal transduction histidine kinase (bacteriophytochrome)